MSAILSDGSSIFCSMSEQVRPSKRGNESRCFWCGRCLTEISQVRIVFAT